MMEPLAIALDELDRGSPELRRVRTWRVERLQNLGLPFVLAESFADSVDWHALADLVDRGCPLHLALEIVR
jgi:hypothetical protein